MTKYFYCCIFFILSASVSLAQHDEAGVLAAFKAGNEAMGAYDAERMTAFYAEKAVIIDPYGQMVVGRDAILPFYKGLFQIWGQPKGEKFISDKQVIRFLTPDIALLHTLNTLLTKDQSGKELTDKYAQSVVFTRQNGKWLRESEQIIFINPRQ